MRYWLDTEFIEDGKAIDLISIGIVAEDGREYYAVSKDFNRAKLFENPWLIKNVVPSLPFHKVKPGMPWAYNNFDEAYDDLTNGTRTWQFRQDIAQDIKEFCDIQKYGAPEFWGYYADYDWVVFCWLFGNMMDLPNGFPMYCRDIKQWCDELGNPKLPEQGKGEHHALSDAKWARDAYHFLKQLQGAS